MSISKEFIRDWLPPAATRWIRQVRGGGIRFEGEYASWEEASSHCTGYDSTEILAKVLAATLKVKRGDAAFERDSVLFDEVEYVWPVLAGLLWVAARNGGVLNVLDFGGALGSSYFQNRKILQTLPYVRWNVVEQAHYVDAGRMHIQDEVLRFYKTIEESLAENKPNVILLSSVLQYLELPCAIIEQLSSIGALTLIVDRTPFSKCDQDRLMIQRVPKSIYKASYPMWVFSETKFMKKLDADWHKIAVTLSPEAFVHSASGFEFAFQGMLLESN